MIWGEYEEYDWDTEQCYYWLEINHEDYDSYTLPPDAYRFTVAYNETAGNGCRYYYDSLFIWFEDYGYRNSFDDMQLDVTRAAYATGGDSQSSGEESSPSSSSRPSVTTLPVTQSAPASMLQFNSTQLLTVKDTQKYFLDYNA